MKTGCFTICSRNYLAYALTLRDSVLEAEPGLDFKIFLADEPVSEKTPEGVEIIPVSDLGAEEMRDMAFRYTVIEFNTAVKPFCFDYMFDKGGYDAVIYLDPDIRLFGPMQQVHTALAAGASAVLTPHICKPLPEADAPLELDLMRSGTFNLGFAAFANTSETRTFITWWKNKLREYCRVDLQNGLFVDQRFVDFAPSFLEHLTVLRDPGYNVAYWNFANRPVEKTADGWTAAGSPLVFFHFSGVAPGDTSIFSKHQSRFDATNIGDAAELLRDYLDRLAANNHARWTTIPYGFGHFKTGEPIIDPMRQGPPANPADPFVAPNHTYWNAPSERVEQTPGTCITRLMLAIHEARPDLRQAFPLSTAAGRRDFHAWFVAHGAREYRIDENTLGAALSESAIRAQTIARHFARLRLAMSKTKG
ncbi:hypothetical protein [Hyphomonas jannaschiana]|uniref:Uncharacterized protein n=1 Tax=Hyphomonas jannaschiana VP2 TaxID=1280952 RepID=A0A059FF58_9PROT|nr:hypothetical protein [Hyphomonas jannaschiana]KCZ89264.1 hypothetical protein HJA_08202 [Hyphomonas jannaschiana VP2]